MENDDLKPCPFCNAEMQFEESGYEHPYSDTCPLDSLYIEDGHVAAWNRRATPTVQEAAKVRVKPLVWKDERGGNSRSDVYLINPSYGQGPEPFLLARGSNIIGWFGDDAAAKAAAQADYETCTLAAVEAVDLRSVREALRQCAEAMDLFFASYPHMTKGYILDACDAARAALALIDGENGNG